MRIRLSYVDFDHLDKFKTIICASNKISIGTEINKNGTITKSATISVADSILSSKLVSYGIVPNKSLIVKPIRIPEIVSYDFERHYWRGLIDGDGWVTIRKDGIPIIGICGTIDIVNGFIEFCKKYTKTKISPNKTRNIWQSSISGERAKIIGSVLYENTNISLDRKMANYNKFKEHKE